MEKKAQIMVTLTDLAENTERNNSIMQRALREIDEQVLAQALVDLTEKQREIIYRNMSPRGKDGARDRGSASRRTVLLADDAVPDNRYAPPSDLGEIIGVPEGTVKYRLYELRRALRILLSE